MPIHKKLGIFLETPETGPGGAGVALAPSNEEIRRLKWAFVRDLASTAASLRRIPVTLFLPGWFTPPEDDPEPAIGRPVIQKAGSTGERLSRALEMLLSGANGPAVLISAACPDLPVQFLKRAFLKLKHRDMVLGPDTAGGGWCLLGLKRLVPELLIGLPGGESNGTVMQTNPAGPGTIAFDALLARAQTLGLDTTLIFPWYRVETAQSLRLLEAMIRGRKLAGSRRLRCTEPVLARLLRKLQAG